MIKRLLLLGLVATVAGGTATGFAATLNVGSHHLWAGSQTLTKSSCTITGASTDTFVDQSSPSTSNSGAATLDVVPDTGSQRWTFLKFDLTACALPATAGADTATLRLYLTNAPQRSFTLNLGRATSSWSSGLTWTGAQSVTTTATASASSGTAGGTWVTFAVTGDVDDFIKGGVNEGWRLTESGATQNVNKDLTQFASTESGSNAPQLVISYEK